MGCQLPCKCACATLQGTPCKPVRTPAGAGRGHPAGARIRLMRAATACMRALAPPRRPCLLAAHLQAARPCTRAGVAEGAPAYATMTSQPATATPSWGIRAMGACPRRPAARRARRRCARAARCSTRATGWRTTGAAARSTGARTRRSPLLTCMGRGAGASRTSPRCRVFGVVRVTGGQAGRGAPPGASSLQPRAGSRRHNAKAALR